MIRLRGKTTTSSTASDPMVDGGFAAATSLNRPLNKRRFLKTLLTGVGLAAVAEAGQLALAPQGAFALTTISDDLTVTGVLTVQGTGNSSFSGSVRAGNSYNGIFYIGDPNWGFAVRNPAAGQYFTELRYAAVPGTNTDRRAGIRDHAADIWVLCADNNRNVGIGTTSPAPSAKLDVAGAIAVNGATAIDATGTAQKSLYGP